MTEIQNDPEISEQITKIKALAEKLNYLFREQQVTELFIALSDIDLASKAAQWRINHLKFK